MQLILRNFQSISKIFTNSNFPSGWWSFHYMIIGLGYSFQWQSNSAFLLVLEEREYLEQRNFVENMLWLFDLKKFLSLPHHYLVTNVRNFGVLIDRLSHENGMPNKKICKRAYFQVYLTRQVRQHKTEDAAHKQVNTI